MAIGGGLLSMVGSIIGGASGGGGGGQSSTETGDMSNGGIGTNILGKFGGDPLGYTLNQIRYIGERKYNRALAERKLRNEEDALRADINLKNEQALAMRDKREWQTQLRKNLMGF